MARLLRFWLGLWALLWSVLIVGPLGNYLYDFYQKPTPAVVAFLRTYWLWEFATLVVVGSLTLWSWLASRQHCQAAEQLRREKADQERHTREVPQQPMVHAQHISSGRDSIVTTGPVQTGGQQTGSVSGDAVAGDKYEVHIAAPSALFPRPGLSMPPLTGWKSLGRILRHVLENELEREGYIQEQDVRPLPSWTESFPVLMITGESGQGKSWQLFRLAYEKATGGEAVVLVKAIGDEERDLKSASDTVWKNGLNQDQSITLDRLAQRHKDVASDNGETWLTICVDDVQSPDEARRLSQQDWKNWRMRLAITVPETVGQAIKRQYPNRVQLLQISDFTLDELQSYFQQ